MSIHFVLSKKLQRLDDLGEGYVYVATKHPSSDDLMVVHFKEKKRWRKVNYEIEEVMKHFRTGTWVQVEGEENERKRRGNVGMVTKRSLP